jgi:hypothetical protein
MKFWDLSRSILVTLAAAMPVFGENMAGIPSTGESEVDVTELAGPPTPEIVRLVGQTQFRPLPDNRSPHTVAVDLPAPAAVSPITVKSGSPISIPGEAKWPDANDRLAVAGARKAGAGGAPPARNPWEPLAPRNLTKAEMVFACGGTICGDGAMSVGIVNGRIVSKGSAFDQFVVSLVTPQAVVLNYEGDLLVVPRGRRVTVEN